MREFFRGWRRKIGVVTLVMACVFMMGWVRSAFVDNKIDIPTPDRNLLRVVSTAGELQFKKMEAFEVGVGNEVCYYDLGGPILPYWSIVAPLTLISFWLMLFKPRPSTPKTTPQPVVPKLQ